MVFMWRRGVYADKEFTPPQGLGLSGVPRKFYPGIAPLERVWAGIAPLAKGKHL